MPSIIVRVIRGRTIEQKRELVKRMTDDMVSVFGSVRDSVNIVIEEVEPENSARGGVLRLDRDAGPISSHPGS